MSTQMIQADSPSSHSFVFVPSPGPSFPSNSNTSHRLRPRDAIIDTSSSVVSFSTRPRGQSFTHRSRSSGSSELEALREELESDPELTPTIARTRSHISRYRVKSPPPPVVYSPRDVLASLSGPPERSEPLRRAVTQSQPRSRGVTTSLARTDPQPLISKYATISGSSPLSRRRGMLSDIVASEHRDSASSTSTNVPTVLNTQLSSPPVRLPGASLPPVSSSNGPMTPGRRRSSSQPPLPGSMSSTAGDTWSRISSCRSSLPPPPLAPPTNAVLKPYRLMDLLYTTMTSDSGGYITSRLHVPNEVWSQTGVKLSNLSEKIRVVEILISGLEEVQVASQKFITNKKDNNSHAFFSTLVYPFTRLGHDDDIQRWLIKLDDWNAVCDGILASFGRKLGVGEGFVTKKNGGAGVPFWRVVRSTNLDSLAIYVSGLVRLFRLAQMLGEHTKALLRASPSSLYTALPTEIHHALELRLRRSSEFFSNVVLTFVVRDLYLLLDKYVKKGEKWLAE